MSFNATTDELVLKLQTAVNGKPMGAITPWIALLEILRQQGVVDYTLSGTTPGDNSKPWLDTVNKQLKCFNAWVWDGVDIGTAFPALGGRKFLARYGGNVYWSGGPVFAIDNTFNTNNFIGSGGPSLSTNGYNIWYNEIEPLDYNLKGQLEVVNYIDRSMFPQSGAAAPYNPSAYFVHLGFKPSHTSLSKIHFYTKMSYLNVGSSGGITPVGGDPYAGTGFDAYRFDLPMQMFENIINIYPTVFRYEVCDIQSKFGKSANTSVGNGVGTANTYRVIELYRR